MYQHDDSETNEAYFQFSVDDRLGTVTTGRFLLSIDSVNDNDPIANDDRLIVAEGGTATEADLTNGGTLLASDTDADLPNDVLRIGMVPVSEPNHGELILNADGSFIYTHDGSENTIDQFSYELFDADGGQSDVALVIIVIEPVNDLPTIQQNQLSITMAGSVVLSENDLFATDSDGTPTSLVFTVMDLTGGHFELLSAPGNTVFSFTQAQVAAGLVQFVSDGSSVTPGYSISVSDGEAVQPPSVATITTIPTTEPEISAAEPETVLSALPSVVTITTPSDSEPQEQDARETDDKEQLVEEEIFTDEAIFIPDIADEVATILAMNTSDQVVYKTDRETSVPPPTFSKRTSTAEVVDQRDVNSISVAPLTAFEMNRLLEGLNEVRNGNDRISDLYQDVIGSSAGVTAGLTVGYVAWLIRGGVLLSSALSSLPAWQFIDPLPVLSYKQEKDKNTSSEDDSLESIVQSTDEAIADSQRSSMS